jgi:hypothetical protein
MIWWPVVKQRLVVLLPTLEDWEGVVVYNGAAKEDRGVKQWITVGWSQYGPQGGSRGSGFGDSGSWSNVEETISDARSEAGTVLCELVVWGGDESLAATYEARAFALVNSLDAAIRADETLGVLPYTSTTDLGAEVITAQDKAGAQQRLILSVNYTARS